ncbi:hypothetical protein PQX77_003654 [Marasmius sp. AFHP31]|nr:hypothetical protein PQX77_003654 [Marasmius sp. AFHP31]
MTTPHSEVDWELVNFEEGSTKGTIESSMSEEGVCDDGDELQNMTFLQRQEGMLDLGKYHVDSLRLELEERDTQLAEMHKTLKEKTAIINNLEEEIRRLKSQGNEATQVKIYS